MVSGQHLHGCRRGHSSFQPVTSLHRDTFSVAKRTPGTHRHPPQPPGPGDSGGFPPIPTLRIQTIPLPDILRTIPLPWAWRWVGPTHSPPSGNLRSTLSHHRANRDTLRGPRGAPPLWSTSNLLKGTPSGQPLRKRWHCANSAVASHSDPQVSPLWLSKFHGRSPGKLPRSCKHYKPPCPWPNVGLGPSLLIVHNQPSLMAN